MKKSAVLFLTLLIAGILILSSCGPKMYAKSPYREGHHGTSYGHKAQEHASKVTKHFWF